MAVVQEAYIQGVSTRRVDDLVQALGMQGISKSQVSKTKTSSRKARPRTPLRKRKKENQFRRTLMRRDRKSGGKPSFSGTG